MATNKISKPHAEVEIPGLRDFQRDLKKFEPAIHKQLRSDLKDIAKDVVLEARRRAPERSGKLKRGITASATQKDVAVVSKVPYAWAVEKGARHPVFGTDKWVFQPAQPHVFPAVEHAQDAVWQAMQKALDKAIREAGFK